MNPNPVARRRRTLSSAALALIALALLAVFGGTSRAHAAAPAIRPVCGAVPLGHSRCLSWVKGNASPLAQTPSGYGPADLQSAYALPSARRRQRPDGRDRRRVRRPEGRVRPRHLPVAPTACRRARPPTAASTRSTRPAARCRSAAATPAGRRRSRSTSTWSARSARTATSCSSRRPRTSQRSRHGGRHGRAASAPTRSATATAAASRAPTTTSDDVHFNHPGVAITASSGDDGYGVAYPAASRYVTAVGGTSLTSGDAARAAGRETAWSGAGTGC